MLDNLMLTTLDNPYNPFTEFDAWLSFDIAMGYNTCGYIARIAKSSHELSEVDEAKAIDDAMNEIISLNLSGNYIKVGSDYKPKT